MVPCQVCDSALAPCGNETFHHGPICVYQSRYGSVSWGRKTKMTPEDDLRVNRKSGLVQLLETRSGRERGQEIKL